MSRIKTFLGIVALLAVLAEAAGTITPKTPSTLDGCYQITSKEELYGFAAIVNGTEDKEPYPTACARLGRSFFVNNKVLIGDGELNVADTAEFIPWTPIKNFRGTFEGQGYTIFGLYFNDSTSSDVGLFGRIESYEDDRDVFVRNLLIYDSYFKGNSYVGAIAGEVDSRGNKPVVIYNTRSYAQVYAKSVIAGGMVGLTYGNVQIEKSFNGGDVTARHVVGGIVGILTGVTASITNVYNLGTVTAFNKDEGNSMAGGIVGQVSGALELKNVFNNGSVVGYNVKGGIAGILSGGSAVLVNAYNTGKIQSLEEETEYTGAIIGRYAGVVEDFTYANIYYLKGDVSDLYGVEVPEEMMANGAVAYLLHNYYYEGLDATIWGQPIGSGSPSFIGNFKGDLPQVFEKMSLHTYEGDVTVLPEDYVPGYRYDLPLVFREDYVFSGWYDNAEFKGNSVKFIPATASGEQEFWARYTPVYKVSYQTGSGVVNIDEEVLSYVEGVGVVLPKNVTREGAIFRGWYKDKNFKGDRLYEIGPEESGDVVLYAKWLEKKEPSKDEDGCYVIKDESDLYGFAAIVNGTDGFSKNTSPCAYLEDDIVVNKNVLKLDGSLNVADSAGFAHWVPINGFNGVFDGRGHSVFGLYVKCDSVRDSYDGYRGYGFFGSLGVVGSNENTIIVKNIGIEASYFEVKGDFDKVGALVGVVNGNARTAYSDIQISNCYNRSTVNAVSYPGGIVGVINSYSNTVIENCYNTGLIEGKHNNAGGLVGSIKYDANVNIENCYNVGYVLSYGTQLDNDALVGEVKSDIKVTNCYYLKVAGVKASYGRSATLEQFENGDVAYALHQGENGSIWGQNVGMEPLPNFCGVIKNYLEESSSSEVKSSSSSAVKSSSSEAKSSSSSKAKSSSSIKAKSSSSRSAKSSSSRKKLALYCDGKECNDAVLEKWEAPRFQVIVAGRNVLVSGAQSGSNYAVLDIQGQVLATGRVEGGILSVVLPHSGNFLIRIDRQIQRIAVK